LPLAEGQVLGVYKGELVEAEGRSRRFRLLLFLASPDRIHGEVLSPLGSTVMIVDGGEGRLAVTLARDGLSYVGSARPEILARILGVRLSLRQLVAAFLEGARGESFDVRRSAEERSGLPESLEFRTTEVALRFQLKKVRPLPELPDGLGSGQPAAGTEIRPLEELGAEHRVGSEGPLP
jgi:hypothetical protein